MGATLQARYTVRLDEERSRGGVHWYEVTRHDATTVYLPGATGVLEVLDKPALGPWRARVAAERMRAQAVEAVEGTSNESIREALRGLDVNLAANASYGLSRGAMDTGSRVHKAIEGVLQDHRPPRLAGVDTEVLQAFHAWHRWWATAGLTPLHVELPVASCDHGYAGTVDLVAADAEGRVWLLDWKTGSGLWDTYHLQAAAYRHALWETTGVETAGARLVRLPKDGTDAEEVLVVDNRLLEVFLGVLAAWRWRNGVPR